MTTRKPPSILREFLLLFGPLAAVVLLVITVVVVGQQAKILEKIELREQGAVAIERQALESSVSSHLSDALLLSSITAFHVYSGMPDTVVHHHLVEEFRSFSRTKRVYDQVRYLDGGGMERVRVNWTSLGSVVVPTGELQDKSKRSYFTKGLRTGGEVYVSAFDLNVENGAVERPIKPMIRLATPVVDTTGRPAGVVVLNYLGDHLLDRLRNVSKTSASPMFLLNKDGYWLLGPSRDDEWGFMYPDRESRTLAVANPDVWKHIAGASAGQFLVGGDLYTFVTASPLGSGSGSRAVLHSGEAEEAWVILSIVPAGELEPSWRTAVVGFTSGLLLLLALISWQWGRARE